MKFGLLSVAAALALLPAAASSAVVEFAAPAGNLPAEHLRGAISDAVLPSGRIVTPFGQSVVTGINALGMTLSPDGRFAIVSNDDEGQGPARSAVDSQVLGGPSIAVIDTATMRIADRFAFPGETYFAGVAAVRDPRYPARTLVFAAGGASNAVYVVDLDARGHLTPDLTHVIAIPGPIDPAFSDFAQSFPAALVAAPDGRRVYAVAQGGDSVTAIDTAARTISGTSGTVGFFPFGAALAANRLLVTNAGLMRYARVPSAPLVPPFATPPADALRASSLSFVALAANGDLAPVDSTGESATPQALAMDAAPDGLRIVGGAQPAAVSVTPDNGYAFVAMTNVDRIATVALAGSPQVIGGTELRLFDRGPYGTQPVALALSRDGTRLYAALAGLNAVAVLDARDPTHLHRLGLLPTGWLPSAIALSQDDRTLYVVNTKGFGHDIGPAGGAVPGADSSAVWSTLQKIDLGTVTLNDTTLTTLKNTREIREAAPQYPRALQNVVVILTENTTFDAMLGDLGYGPADPSYVKFGAAMTPNLHALARRYALAGNLFADAQSGRRPPANTNGSPEDSPRAGYIFNNLARHGISFRDYGDLVRLAGYDQGEAPDLAVDDPAFAGVDDRQAPTRGLGGRYGTNVPALAVLADHIDLNYPGWNLRIRNERRAREFIRDYTALVNAHQQPRYTHIWLPADRTASGSLIPPIPERVADGDQSLGMVVEYLSHLRSWKNTVIFVMPAGAQSSRDHVDGSRTYALVVSPFAKPMYVGVHHLSTVSVLKTSEQILGLPPLALDDLLATDMSDYFTTVPDVRPFRAIPVPGRAGRIEGKPIARLLEPAGENRAGAASEPEP